MALKELFRRLAYEISQRERVSRFAVNNIYLQNEHDEHEELEVGESYISITGKIGFVNQ